MPARPVDCKRHELTLTVRTCVSVALQGGMEGACTRGPDQQTVLTAQYRFWAVRWPTIVVRAESQFAVFDRKVCMAAWAVMCSQGPTVEEFPRGLVGEETRYPL